MTTLNASQLRQAAVDAAGGQDYPRGALYVVATPIGNRADLTLRAIHVLGLVDAIACEDTRHSAPLLLELGIDKPLVALHRHNEQGAAATLLARLGAGERVAYISDAGTPAISDPGAALVAAAQAAGYRTIPIPGPSSAITAVSVAGDTGAQPGFAFLGFLPSRGAERTRALAALAANPATLVLFEAPHRIETLLAEISDRCSDRRVTVCRELTKQFETVATVATNELSAWLEADPNRRRGEFVIVVHAATGTTTDLDSPIPDAALDALLAVLPLREAVALAVQLSGAPRNAVYRQALALRDRSG